MYSTALSDHIGAVLDTGSVHWRALILHGGCDPSIIIARLRPQKESLGDLSILRRAPVERYWL
jgi:hypothetical protein